MPTVPINNNNNNKTHRTIKTNIDQATSKQLHQTTNNTIDPTTIDINIDNNIRPPQSPSKDQLLLKLHPDTKQAANPLHLQNINLGTKVERSFG